MTKTPTLLLAARSNQRQGQCSLPKRRKETGSIRVGSRLLRLVVRVCVCVEQRAHNLLVSRPSSASVKGIVRAPCTCPTSTHLFTRGDPCLVPTTATELCRETLESGCPRLTS